MEKGADFAGARGWFGFGLEDDMVISNLRD